MDTWPEDIRNEFAHHLKYCGMLLADRRVFSPPSDETTRRWDALIDLWADDDCLPLFVRKSGKNAPRGSVESHSDGRKIVFVDNSPAQWAWSKATRRECPTIESLVKTINDGGADDHIPVAHTLTTAEWENPDRSKFATALTRLDGKDFYLGQKNLKLAHIDDVKLAGAGDVKKRKLTHLKEHFKRLMKPSNMFVVPLRLHGLSEVKEIVECFRGWSGIQGIDRSPSESNEFRDRAGRDGRQAQHMVGTRQGRRNRT